MRTPSDTATTTIAEVRDRATIPVWADYGPCAAKLLGIGRSAAYEMARSGDLPGVIRLGHRYVCSVPVLLALLGEADQ